MAIHRSIPGGGSEDYDGGQEEITPSAGNSSEVELTNYTFEPVEGAVVPLYSYHEITNFFLLVTIIVCIIYVIMILKTSKLRQEPRYVLLVTTVMILMLEMIVTFSTQIGYPSWVNPRLICDVAYVASRSFYDATLLLYIVIIAERLNAIRDFLSILSMGLAITLVVVMLAVSFVWEGLAQHVIGDGTTSLDDGTCYLDVTRQPLSIVYPVMDSLLLGTLGGLSIAGFVIKGKYDVDADDVVLPSVTGFLVTLMKLPYVILVAVMTYFSPRMELLYTFYMIELGPALLVPLIWLLGDRKTRAVARTCCCPCLPKDDDSELEPLNRYIH